MSVFVEPSEGAPRKTRKVDVWLSVDHLMKLDHEVMRRKAAGLDINEDGVRINMNRSIIIRELIDDAYDDPTKL